MKRTFYLLLLLIVVLAVPARAAVSDNSDSLRITGSSETADAQNIIVPGFHDATLSAIESGDAGLLTPVTINNGGRMNLTSGQPIFLKPGTKVLAGGYLRAAVLTDAGERKSVEPRYKKSKKPTRIEKIAEPLIIAETLDAISPFAKRSGRSVGEGNNNEERLNALISEVAGISPEQNRKQAVTSFAKMNFRLSRIANVCAPHLVALSDKRETITVLRL